MDYSEIYFSVLSIATIAVAGLFIAALFYVLAILNDVKRLSKIARREAEIIARGFGKGLGLFGESLSEETAGFLKMLFSLLLSQFGVKTKRSVKSKIKSI